MKVVTIMGSHRNKHNTDKALGYLLGKIKEEHDVFNINVNQSVIKPCKACEYCLSHQGECVIKDDAMTEIYEKIENCDLLIIASPVYFSAFPSKIKALIDRTQMLYNLKDRSIIKPKKFVVIAVGGAPHYPKQFQAVDNTLEWYKKYLKCDEIGFIQFSHTDKLESMDNKKGLEGLDAVAKKINSL